MADIKNVPILFLSFAVYNIYNYNNKYNATNYRRSLGGLVKSTVTKIEIKKGYSKNMLYIHFFIISIPSLPRTRETHSRNNQGFLCLLLWISNKIYPKRKQITKFHAS